MLDLLFGQPKQSSDIGRLVDFETPKVFLAGGSGYYASTTAGVRVNEQVALTCSAVWCATRILCEPCGTLPFLVYERTADDDRRIARDYQLYSVIKSYPNDQMEAQPFWEGRAQHMVNWGNGFAEIERTRDGDVSALHPIHPSRVCQASKEEESQGYAYKVRNNESTSVLMRADEMLHMPGALTEDGIWGKGVIRWARESIGFYLAVQHHGATYFGSGGQPRGVITGLNIKDPEARKQFRLEWKTAHGNPKADEVAIMPPGAEFKPIMVSNEDSQFLGTLTYNIREIARWYRVPLHMLMDLEKASYASIEINSLEFVIHHLWPWIRRIQGQCNLKLIPMRDRARYYTEHNLRDLLRGDLKSRIESYRLGISTGLYTINECRRFENLPGIGEAGDEHYLPLNMTTAERMQLGLDPVKPGAGPGSDQNGEQGRESVAAMIEKHIMTIAQRDQIREHLGNMVKDDHDRDCEESGQAWKEQLRPAVRGVVRDALGRWGVKFSNAAKRAAMKEKDFSAWSTDFSSKNRVTLTQSLEPAATLLAAFGVKTTANEMADRVIADSHDRLTAAMNNGPSELLAVLDSWPAERADCTTDAILGDKS